MASLVLSVIKYPHEFFKNQTVDEQFYSTIGSLVSKMVTRIKTSDADDYHLNNETMMSTVEDIVSVIGFAMECTVIDRKRFKIENFKPVFCKLTSDDLGIKKIMTLIHKIFTLVTSNGLYWPTDLEISLLTSNPKPLVYRREWPQMTSSDKKSLKYIFSKNDFQKKYSSNFTFVTSN